jgi:hypothetical protein
MKSNKNPWKLAGAVSLALSLVFTSCQKENDNDPDQNQAAELSVASARSQAAYEDVFDIVLQDGEANGVSGRGESASRIASCATVTISPLDPGTWPKTMTIDFGTGCTAPNGITRKGKVIAVLSERIRLTGTTITVTFENYYVNNYKVEGTITITNNGGTGLNFTRQVANGKLTYPDGTTYYTYTGSHSLAQTAGASTITFVDDVFNVTGGGTTVSSTGNSLTTNITTPLVKATSCHNVSAGVTQFTYNNLSGSLDFGNGTCDNLATLTIGPFTQVVILP